MKFSKNEVTILKRWVEKDIKIDEIFIVDIDFVSQETKLSFSQIEAALDGLRNISLIRYFDKEENWIRIFLSKEIFEIKF